MKAKQGASPKYMIDRAPPVGVVVANHNNGAYVEQAIQSVAEQSVRDITVVVVDDASTDGSDEAIRRCLARLDDQRFRYVKLDGNVGQGGAMRRGMAHLHTPFIAFLDSDDVWYADFLARHIEVHLNGDFPVGVTYCDSHIIDAAGTLLAGTAWFFDSTELHDKTPRSIDPNLVPKFDSASGSLTYAPRRGLTFRPHWSPAQSTNSMASMMFRRSFIDLVMVPPDEVLRLYVDFYLATFACLLTGSIAIHEPLYAYRMHGANKHSNAAVPGGAYNSSLRKWGIIRDEMLALIQSALRARRDAIDLTFGEERRADAEAAVAAALNAPNVPNGGNGSARPLQSAFGRHYRARAAWHEPILQLLSHGKR